MKWRIYIMIALVVFLAGIVTFEQIYTDNALQDLLAQTEKLCADIQNEDQDASIKKANNLVKFWHQKEKTISLFVDYRDIEQIARQANYVLTYVQSCDYELALVECNQLYHVVDTFYNIIKIDWQNIL